MMRDVSLGIYTVTAYLFLLGVGIQTRVLRLAQQAVSLPLSLSLPCASPFLASPTLDLLLLRCSSIACFLIDIHSPYS